MMLNAYCHGSRIHNIVQEVEIIKKKVEALASEKREISSSNYDKNIFHYEQFLQYIFVDGCMDVYSRYSFQMYRITEQ